MTRRRQWVGFPVEIPRECENRRVAGGAGMLLVASWAYCQIHATDGRVAAAEARRLPYFTPRRAEALVQAGFWTPGDDGGFVVVDFLEVNATGEEREAARQGNADRQAAWRARNADREAAQLARDDDLPPTIPGDGGNGPNNALRNGAIPLPLPEQGERERRRSSSIAVGGSSDRAEPGTTKDLSEGEGDRTSAEAIPDFTDPAWAEFNLVWFERLSESPTEAQCRILWPVVQRDKRRATGALAEAPRNVRVYDLIAYILNETAG